MVLFLLKLLLSAFTGKLSSIFRLKTALRTDKRIKFMEEIITGVRVIKMFAWETPFGKMIDSARKNELNILRKNSYVRCLYMTFALFTTRMAIFCTMLSICLLYGNENISAAKVNLLSTINVVGGGVHSQNFVTSFVRDLLDICSQFARNLLAICLALAHDLLII